MTLVIILLFLISGCENNQMVKETSNDENDEIEEYIPTEGGQIVIPLTNFNTLNPLRTENLSYYHFSKLIFEGLFELDGDLNVIPQLAEDYKINNDGKTISIQLKKDVLWHDGTSFKSSDVVFTINTLKYAKTESTYNSPTDMSRIIDVKIIDDYNLDIIYDKEFSNNLELLTFPIIPQHIFQSSGNSYAKALEIDNYTPIGTGPYKFVSYEKFKTINLIANENYRENKPYITKVEGKVLEDDNLILTAFETGQLSMANTVGVDWDKYKSNNRIKALEYVSNIYEFIGFNFEKEIFQGEKGLAIRKAINYGVDRQAIIQKNFLGHGTQIDVPIHPDSWLMSAEGHTYGYNVDKAKEELKAGGWLDRDQDGILEDENGEKLSLKVLTNSYNSLRLRTSDMIVEDLKKLGFEIIIDYDKSLVENINEEKINTQWGEINSKIQSGDFDLAILGWELSILPDLSFMYHSSQVNNNNFINYSNENMDQLLENTMIIANRQDKFESYAKLQKFIVNELPYVSLFFRNRALLVDSKIKGNLTPTFFNPYKGLEDCFIPEDLQ